MILEWATFPLGHAVGQSIAHRRAGAHTHRGHQGDHLGTRRRAQGRTRGRALICLLVSEGLFFFLAGRHTGRHTGRRTGRRVRASARGR